MEKIVVLTGAGMSADSGLKTFRDSGGLWEGYDIEKVATKNAWENNKKRVLEFYNKRRLQAHAAEPNEGHIALSKLQRAYDVTIITQNVDSLHERAGSKKVIHLHGELSKVRSEENPSLIYEIGDKSIEIGDTADDGAQLRPHVVWFGEAVPKMQEAMEIVPLADLLIVIGTSLVVYPAAGLVTMAKTDIPKYVIDPVVPDLPNRNGWTHIKKRAAAGTPKLVNKLLKEV